MKNYFKRFFKDDDGAELVEYCIVLAVVAVLAVGVFAVVRIANNRIQDAGEKIGNLDVDGAVGTTGSGTGGMTGTPTGSGASGVGGTVEP